MAPTDAKITLLVVEDEALIAENLCLTLDDLGYAVAAACYTYAEAEAAIAAGPPADLVLLDINLGGPAAAGTGLDLARQLGERGIPFIFLTAYSDLDTIRQATRLQPSGYLIKPVNGAALFAAIQTAIARASGPLAAPLPAAPPAEAPDYFFVKRGPHPVKLYWAEVASIEAGKNYVTLRAPALRLSHAVRGSLTTVLDQLLPAALREQFIRVNRRTCLNVRHITAYDKDYVYCGPDRYENARTAQPQLEQLKLD